MEMWSYITLTPGVKYIKLRISDLWIYPYFRKMENESIDKIRKYRKNVHNTEIQSFITLTPGVKLIKLRISD